MKKFVLLLLSTLSVTTMKAQPRPFEPDPSFVPTLEFLQKSWTGEYDGLEPNSKMILTLSRTLVLNEDLTYKNEVKGQIKNLSEEMLLRFETGTYQYNPDKCLVTYSIEVDSTLDINILLRGEELTYAVNHYIEEGLEKKTAESVQFTRAAKDDARQWILFDQQLMSPIDQMQKAVYVMTGKDIEPTGIIQLHNRNYKDVYYDINGHQVGKVIHGLYIANGKIILVK